MPLITIPTVSVPHWNGSTASVALLILVNGSFTALSGTIYPQTMPSGLPYSGFGTVGTFYQSVACTVSSGSLVVPSITLDSTTDSPDNPDATYSAVLWDTNLGQPIQPFGTFTSFSLTPSPTTVTWAQIASAQSGLL